MVYYIRFVKVPEVFRSKSRSGFYEVFGLIDIRNDLGENLFTGSTDLVATLFQFGSNEKVNAVEINWYGTEWTKEVRVGLAENLSSINMYLEIRCRHDKALEIEGAEGLRPICAVQSAPFETKIGSKAEGLAKRLCFRSDYYPHIAPWEQVGSTIFGHVWDAGVVLTAHLLSISIHRNDDAFKVKTPLSHLLLEKNSQERPLRILELGSGVGIVALGLAAALENCVVVPSDTEDAHKLLSLNVASSQSAQKPLSKIEDPRILHWDMLDHRKSLHVNPWDLILVSDCTYNASSVPSLVETISEAVVSSSALIVVALKRRHESESIFYERMDQAGLDVIHHHVFRVPDPSREDVGLEEEEIEMYHFKRRECA